MKARQNKEATVNKTKTRSDRPENGEDRFLSAFENMLEGVQMLGHDWRYLYLNHAAEVHNRRPNQELLGNRYMDMWPGIEETHVFSVIKHCLEDRVSAQWENRFVYPDGEVGWFHLSIQPIPEGVLILSFDITQRVQAEVKSIQMKRLYAALSQVNQTIVRVKNQHELFESICKVAVEFGEFPLAWIGVLDHESGLLTAAAMHGFGQNEFPFQSININELPYDDGLIGLSLKSGQAQFSNDIQVDPRMVHWRETAVKGDYHSAAAIPISKNSQTVGVLNLYAVDMDFFQAEEEQSLLKEMGMDISFALDIMESEKLLRQWADAFEHCAHGIAIGHPSGKLLTCNPAFARSHGSTIQEISSMPILNMYAAQDHEQIKGFIAQTDREGSSRFEANKVRKDGSTYPVEMDLVSVRDGNGNLLYRVATQQDITERKQAEEKIQRQLQRLNGLRAIDTAISSSFDIHVTLDIVLQQVLLQLGVDAAAILFFNAPEKTIEYAASRGFHSNALYQVQLKLSEGLASRAVRERKTIHIPALPTAEGKLAEILRSANEDFVDYYGTPLISKDGIKGVLEIYHRAPLNPDPEWLNFLETLAGQAAIAVDNAQLFDSLQRSNAELEKRVMERTSELNRTNAELEKANRAKDDFLATMSHELRTPLNSILGLSESLLEARRGSLNEHQQKSLQIIEASGHHLLDLINDILDLSKIEAGKLDYFPQSISVDELCRSSLAFVRAQATKKSITISYNNHTALEKIDADPRRLKQALVNLLNNAVKFTPERGEVKLDVGADVEQDVIHFSIVDTGIGIAPDDLKKLFSPFVQVNNYLNRQHDGTGLGLALVQRLTDLHGGSVHVESEVGAGSAFTIRIPIRRDATPPFESIPSVAELTRTDNIEHTGTGSDVPIYRGTILLAEDNMANVLTIGEYLEGYSYKVFVAHDGFEALEQAEKNNPDIILMDIQMPEMDGLEAMRQLRSIPRFASTPIIALTALAMTGDRERCLAAGASEYMSKPVSLKALVNTIETLLT